MESQTVMKDSFSKLQDKKALLEEDIHIIQQEFHRRESVLFEKEKKLDELSQKILAFEAEGIKPGSPPSTPGGDLTKMATGHSVNPCTKALMLVTVWTAGIYLLFAVLSTIWTRQVVGPVGIY
ncbi:hypothetical protein K493DRAFT_68940 [Basidiobolus meristosporus CBS 931.73]|uniref:Uncharacterized protein n=1 Tax=Basidiobolus meristosporus CBS 931.73 TaxID=1314790 RepID=A0A1Y1YZQ9_9FUNG|nr:hypothetical protein K493DRAFT_68940 [Basidiobolus meristosporus CBS 931.73]|eukprot:ORY03528.1 hypothetical protein K493DRAFT_68940 [Basidiobolus meristosporus CBS 931.73]